MLEENDDPSSMEDVLRELDKEKIEIVISKVIRRFSKPATIVCGLHDRKDVESITRDLKDEDRNRGDLQGQTDNLAGRPSGIS